MRVLVACEFSGRVRDAFIAKGHDAISCDLLESETPGPHYQGDVKDVIGDGWDLMIAFPPCTDLTTACARDWPKKQADGRQAKALAFVQALMDADIPCVAIENPTGRINTAIRKPDQIIQPWQFGDPWRKRTCLWLKGLPPLEPTAVVEPTGYWMGGQGYPGDKRYDRRGHRNQRDRARTFPGIAAAMADQWGA